MRNPKTWIFWAALPGLVTLLLGAPHASASKAAQDQLTTLLLGKDVTIYAAHNNGRAYKIGYICGINLCGLVFFGAAFWRPKATSTNREKSQ